MTRQRQRCNSTCPMTQRCDSQKSPTSHVFNVILQHEPYKGVVCCDKCQFSWIDVKLWVPRDGSSTPCARESITSLNFCFMEIVEVIITCFHLYFDPQRRKRLLTWWILAAQCTKSKKGATQLPRIQKPLIMLYNNQGN